MIMNTEQPPQQIYHPRLNKAGARVLIEHPSQATDLASWADPGQIATVAPDGPMPESLHGIAFQSWQDAPVGEDAWNEFAGEPNFDEPAFVVPEGKKAASGAVIVEPDQRIWVVSPTNQFWTYINTFPKGTVPSTSRLSLRANALKEVFEESGLRVELTGFLADSDRTNSFTRYYLARRVGGNPADMGWETQAVHLVPPEQLHEFLNQNVDRELLRTLLDAGGFR